MSHEFEGESYSGPTDTIAADITGAKYDGWPLKYMTVENLLAQDGVTNYVWPHEVMHVTPRGAVKLVKKGTPIMDGKTEIEAPGIPLMVDMSSARAFKLVWNAISDKHKKKTRELVASRGLFCWLMDKIVWPNVGFGG